jgi:hypothetical protein
MDRQGEKHMVRVLNPARGERYLVRVYNPGLLSRLLNGVLGNGDGGASQVFEDFRGRKPARVRLMEARPGTPRTVAELGGLVELSFDSDTTNRRVIRALGLSHYKDDNKDDALEFKPGRVKLVSDEDGDLHLTGFYVPLPAGLQAGRSYYLGCVVNVVYRADKVHIEGDRKRRDYTHEFCEDFGDNYPSLYYRDGYLYFKGGAYTVTSAGIVN